MSRNLAVFCGAIAFLTAFAAVKERAALVRQGYELTALEHRRDRLVISAADRREQVARLSSPAAIASLAGALGLSTEYARDFTIVRVGLPVLGPPSVARAGSGEAAR
jgi:hypothetical protein